MIIQRTYRLLAAIGILLLVRAEPAAGQIWGEVAPMPAARYGISAVVLEGNVYVIGGRDRQHQVLSSVLRYHPDENRWDEGVPPLIEGRSEAAAVVLDGEIYVIGGRGEDGEIVDDVQVYDPRENRWREVEALNVERHGHSAVVLKGRLYVVGGVDESGKLVEAVEEYDSRKDEWNVSNRWRMAHPRVAFALVSIGDTAYSFGGFGGGLVPVPLRHAERFIESGNVDQFLPDLILGERGRLAAAALGDSAFLLGGIGITGVRDDLILFSPSRGNRSDQWTVGPRMSTARESFAAVTVDGRLFAIGGRDESRALSSVEVLIVATNVGVDEIDDLFSANLEQNHPNPFTTSTSIPFVVAGDNAERVVLEVYDVRGQRVGRLLDAHLPPGRHEVTWDGLSENGISVSSGVYFYVLLQADSRRMKTLTRIR